MRILPITVRVRGFANPVTFGMPTAFCVMDGFTRAQYPDRFEEMKRKTHDLMLATGSIQMTSREPSRPASTICCTRVRAA